MYKPGIFIAAATAVLFPLLAAGANAASSDVARATLSNGLRVIVVRNTLAPVVTTVLDYEAGSDEQWIPGLAHATEHMMFRGSATLSSSQLMDAVGITGGHFDADTTPAITQYYFTVPSAYLDIALRAERSRATGLLMSQKLWAQERGAITQEVQQDQSNAFYRLFVKMQDRLIGDAVREEHSGHRLRFCQQGEQHAVAALLPRAGITPTMPSTLLRATSIRSRPSPRYAGSSGYSGG